MCRPGCGGNPPVARGSLSLVAPAAGPAGIDAQREMAELAAQLKAACAENPADAVLAREYRLTLQSLQPARKEPDSELSDLLNGLRR
jgi:hypothetical protein